MEALFWSMKTGNKDDAYKYMGRGVVTTTYGPKSIIQIQSHHNNSGDPRTNLPCWQCTYFVLVSPVSLFSYFIVYPAATVVEAMRVIYPVSSYNFLMVFAVSSSLV